MKALIDNEKYEKHLSGECDFETCEYCQLEDEINEEYAFEDERHSKIAKVGKNTRRVNEF